MRKAVLDTDTLSYVTRRRYPEVNATADQYYRVFRYFTVTAITIAEVVAGLQALEDWAELAEFRRRMGGFEILPLGEAEAVLAGRIVGALSRAGTPIGPLDPFIAAIAIENDLPWSRTMMRITSALWT